MAEQAQPKNGSGLIDAARAFLNGTGMALETSFAVEIGFPAMKKRHVFDLGSENPPGLVACIDQTWEEGSDVSGPPLSKWNEAMYLFLLGPAEHRKIFFVLKSMRGNLSLANYYISRYSHLIPHGVEMWEYDAEKEGAERIF